MLKNEQFFLENIPNDTTIPIYKKKSNKYKLKESYEHFSGNKTKKSFFYWTPCIVGKLSGNKYQCTSCMIVFIQFLILYI